MRGGKIEYLSYGVQILLLLVLVIALACKSWALLSACLGAALVLFVLALVYLIQHKKSLNPYTSQIHRTQLRRYIDVEEREEREERGEMNTHPNAIPSYTYVPVGGQMGGPPPQAMVFGQEVAQPVLFPQQYVHSGPTTEEMTARQMMTFTDYTTQMQAPYKATTMMHQRVFNAADNEQQDPYMIPIPGKVVPLNPYIQPKQDPQFDPDDQNNPMNNLSYLNQ